jgi:CheY-like chemotaxis protein
VRVWIRTALERFDAADLADAWGADEAAPGLFAVLEVADDGAGIDADMRRRIFDPFFTTKLSGRGLGLAAVLGIVRGHRGAVKLASAPGSGSSFRVLLPAAEEARLAPPAAPVRRGALATGRRVLVVDDDGAVLELARELLCRAGYEVATASGGRAALAQLAAAPAAFDVAVVDDAMPDVDGEQMVRVLRSGWPDLPVVIASGHAAEDAASRFAALGVTRLLAKPWTPEALEGAVAAALAERDAGRVA